MKVSYKPLILNLVIPLAVGGLSALVTRNRTVLYESAVKPPLSPPGWVFPVIWTVLFVLMGIAAYLVTVSGGDSESVKTALTVYGIQLAFNFFWPVFFFLFRNYFFAFIWLILLWILILFTVILFRAHSKAAAYLLIPYLVWVTFAGYLNLAVFILNR